MQSNLLQKASLPSLIIRSSTGQVTQVRNHSKIYPWRSNRGNRESYLDNTKTPYTDRNNINEFMKSKKQKKDWMKVTPKDKDNRFNAYKWNDAYKSDPVEAKETAQSRLSRFHDSLRERGAARESKAYDPPEGVQERIIALYRDTQLTESSNSSLSPETAEDILAIDLSSARALKFNLISECIREFEHDLPSSHLNDIECIRDIVEYFSTPVRGVNPYTALLRKEDSLPTNLNLISEPLRYNRESDEFFKGYTAMPGIVSKVPGLRAAKNYPILNQDEFQWPDI